MVKIKIIFFYWVFIPLFLLAQTNTIKTNVVVSNNNIQYNHYNKGFQLFLRKQYELAAKEFIKELKQNFNNFNAYYYLGFCYKNLKQYENALFTFNRALDLKNKNENFLPNIYLAIIKIYFNKKDYNKAISTGLYAIKKGYRNSDILTQLGKIYLYKNDTLRAQKAIDLALELDSTDPQAYNLLGLSYMATKDYQKAVTAFLTAVGFNKKVYYYYSNLGYAYELLGLYKKSLQAYQEALKLNPKSFSIRDSIQRINNIQKKLNEE